MITFNYTFIKCVYLMVTDDACESWRLGGWRGRVGCVRAARFGTAVDASVRPRTSAPRKLEEGGEFLALLTERMLVSPHYCVVRNIFTFDHELK